MNVEEAIEILKTKNPKAIFMVRDDYAMFGFNKIKFTETEMAIMSKDVEFTPVLLVESDDF